MSSKSSCNWFRSAVSRVWPYRYQWHIEVLHVEPNQIIVNVMCLMRPFRTIVVHFYPKYVTHMFHWTLGLWFKLGSKAFQSCGKPKTNPQINSYDTEILNCLKFVATVIWAEYLESFLEKQVIKLVIPRATWLLVRFMSFICPNKADMPENQVVDTIMDITWSSTLSMFQMSFTSIVVYLELTKFTNRNN